MLDVWGPEPEDFLSPSASLPKVKVRFQLKTQVLPLNLYFIETIIMCREAKIISRVKYISILAVNLTVFSLVDIEIK